MPRKPRIEFEGAIYHVMSRGNRGDDIFVDDQDRKRFLDTLEETCGRCGWRIHAFVLMGTHYHLLLETPEANLVAGMKWLQGTYTQRFNSRHKLWGHLLQGRYKALLVDAASNGEYFQTVGSYIHLNPARAKLFNLKSERLSDYSWSSYPLYLRPSKRPGWLYVDRLLGAMGLEDNRSGLALFRSAMQKRVLEIFKSRSPLDADEEWKNLRRGWCFGSPSFKEEMLDKLDGIIGVSGKRDSFNGEAPKVHDEHAAEKLLKAGMLALGIGRMDLQKMKKSSPEKCALAWLVRKHTCVTNEWIKQKLYMGKATNFSVLIKRVEEKQLFIEPILSISNSIKISD